jgi:hypothetical protein
MQYGRTPLVPCWLRLQALVLVAACFIGGANALEAQPSQTAPRISYILPDIGTPGFNTYIEIVAPSDAIGAFGNDSLFFNNPNDPVRVVPANAADTSKIIISPIVISWQGRLISCQIFVLPEKRIGTPNSDNWQLLDAQFKIPLRVIRGNMVSNVDTFYIVRPTRLGNVTGISETVLGEGRLGQRSRRGAMILDSLMLRPGATYTVSTRDCDPTTPGNQGYLPFVMLALGNVNFNGATISVNASGEHGGPGGGGGGGKSCDVFTSQTPGGDGFTGGGGGGFNNAGLLGTSRWERGGVGSGAPSALEANGGSSLNGVTGGISRIVVGVPSAPESSGGGTGHPFGTSGQGWRNDFVPAPTFGGGDGGAQTGSGISQRGFPGKSGSYGAAGRVNDAPSTDAFFAQPYGNQVVVPIAGGSGGGGGNPVLNCAGRGGGGGGAIRIYGRQLFNPSVTANGADGESSQSANGEGGAGSGGHVALMSKLPIVGTTNVSVRGGNHNRDAVGMELGFGRIRIDTPEEGSGGFQVLPRSAGAYVGFVTDTVAVAASPFTQPIRLTGSHRALASDETPTIRIYRRSETGQWVQNSLFDDSSSAMMSIPRWTAPPDLLQLAVTSERDSLFYYVVVKEWRNPIRSGALTQPRLYFSQAAANIITIRPLPLIAALSQSIAMPPSVQCGNQLAMPVSQTVPLRNFRGGLLVVTGATFTSSLRGATQGFSLANPLRITPTDTVQIPTSTTRELRVSFTMPSVIRTLSDERRDTLLVFHNDTIPDIQRDGTMITRPNPLPIPLVAPIRTVLFNAIATGDSLSMPTTIDYGRVSVGSERRRFLVITNTGTTDVRYSFQAPTPPFFLENALATGGTVSFRPGNNQLRIPLLYRATTPTVESISLNVTLEAVGECIGQSASAENRSTTRLTITGRGIVPELDPNPARTTNSIVARLQRCYPASADTILSVNISNRGEDTLRIVGLQLTPRAGTAASVFATSATALSRAIAGLSADTLHIRFRPVFTTQATVNYQAELAVFHNDVARSPWRVPVEVEVSTGILAVRVQPDSISPQAGLRSGQTGRYALGEVNIGSFRTATIATITNTGNTVMVIRSQPMISTTSASSGMAATTSSPFRLVSPDRFPRSIMPGDTVNIVVEFAPTNPAQTPPDVVVSRLLEIVVQPENTQHPCSPLRITTQLLGTPKNPPKMPVILWIDSIGMAQAFDPTVSSGAAVVRVYGRVNPRTMLLNNRDTLVATLRVRGALFFAESIASQVGGAPASITSQRLVTSAGGGAVGADRLITFRIPDVRLTRDSVIVAELRGVPVLGATTAGVIVWEPSTMWTQGERSPYTFQDGGALLNGLITLTVCNEGSLPRLVAPIVPRLLVQPNPADEEAIIKATLHEPGSYTLTLTTVLGEVLTISSWHKTTSGQEDVEVRVSARHLTSGVYGVHLTAPRHRSTVLMQVQR